MEHLPSRAAIPASQAGERRRSIVEAPTAARDSSWLRLVFDTSREPLLLVDAADRVIDANRAACLLFGRSHQELIALALNALLAAERPAIPEHHANPRSLRAVCRGSTPEWKFYAIETVFDDFIEIEQPAVPGQPACAAAADDPTANVRYNATERVALRKILDVLPVAVWVIDLGGNVLLSNSAGRTIWGGGAPTPGTAGGGGPTPAFALVPTNGPVRAY